MATIRLEIGKKNKNGTHPVSFLVCHGNTKKRIPTEIFVVSSEISSNGKKVKNLTKAKIIEDIRRHLEDRLFAISSELMGRDVDASYIVERLLSHQGDIDFFKFADEWLEHTTIKGKKNYQTMLNSLESYLGKRALSFSSITYTMLKGYEEYLAGKPRAKSLYLGQIRHLYREALKQYNTDSEQVIKNDPFQRYRVPRQQLKKGVRALTLDELLKIYHYQGQGRAMLARDCFILSFCLMGMNSVDLYECKDFKGNTIKYNRAKTKDRRSDSAYIEIKIHPFIKGLVKKYRSSNWAFRFHKKYSTASNFNKAINIGLKEVGKAVGIDGLQFYQARHTFATLSRNLMRYSKSDVDEALNHVGTMDIADVYIAKDFSIINDNNFKLIERVFGKIR